MEAEESLHEQPGMERDEVLSACALPGCSPLVSPLLAIILNSTLVLTLSLSFIEVAEVWDVV